VYVCSIYSLYLDDDVCDDDDDDDDDNDNLKDTNLKEN